MRITCPNCAAEYDVPDALLAGGARALRCKRCGTEFTGGEPAGPVDPPPRATVATPPPEAPVPPPQPPVPPKLGAPGPPTPTSTPVRERRAALVGWGLSLLVLAAVAWLAIAYRAEIIAALPASARLFQALGLSG